jgi:hypothetical protein
MCTNRDGVCTIHIYLFFSAYVQTRNRSQNNVYMTYLPLLNKLRGSIWASWLLRLILQDCIPEIDCHSFRTLQEQSILFTDEQHSHILLNTVWHSQEQIKLWSVKRKRSCRPHIICIHEDFAVNPIWTPAANPESSLPKTRQRIPSRLLTERNSSTAELQQTFLESSVPVKQCKTVMSSEPCS